MKIKPKILLGMLITVTALAAMLPAGVAAKGPAGVNKGFHNLSASGKDNLGAPSSYRTNTADVCVFCHTPHGGSYTGALWNRNNPTSTWNHYSSTTLSTYLQGLVRAVPMNEESLLCMSCHDGSISVNHLINDPNDLGGTPVETYNGDPDTTIGLGFILGARIGGSELNTMGTGDLRDDHPISFSYDDVFNSADYVGAGSKVGQLRASNLVTALYSGNSVRFATRPVAGVGTNRVECTTCHDPHVNYNDNQAYSPFLIMPNAGSNMCLACHIK